MNSSGADEQRDAQENHRERGQEHVAVGGDRVPQHDVEERQDQGDDDQDQSEWHGGAPSGISFSPKLDIGEETGVT